VQISQKQVLAGKAAKAAVVGGVKKAAAKKAAKSASAVEKLMGKKSAGKASKAGKKSVSKTKATPDAGKRSKASTGKMTVTQYRKFLSTMKKTKKWRTSSFSISEDPLLLKWKPLIQKLSHSWTNIWLRAFYLNAAEFKSFLKRL